MKTDLTFDLIDGTFKPSEAKSVLFTLIKNKINYHKLEMFSADERYGIELPDSERRVRELTEALAKIEEVIYDSQKLNHDIQISGTIEIHLVKQREKNEVF